MKRRKEVNLNIYCQIEIPVKLDDGIEVELQLPGEDDMSGEHERAAGLPREERPKIDRSVSGRQSCSITGPFYGSFT